MHGESVRRRVHQKSQIFDLSIGPSLSYSSDGMIWNFQHHQHAVYSRNPLVAVIVDLRFSPILKISTGVPEFQDSVRQAFPDFVEESARVVNLQALGPIEVKEDKIFSFLNDSRSKLSLTTGALTLEARGHHDRIKLINDFTAGLRALEASFQPIRSLRLGLRYINILDKGRHETDLQRQIAWSDLVNDPYCNEPTGQGGNDGVFFNVEVTSPSKKDGQMTLRYGLIPEPVARKPVFRFDVDRYKEDPGQVSEIPALLEDFSSDIFCAFRSFAGHALIEWMGGTNA